MHAEWQLSAHFVSGIHGYPQADVWHSPVPLRDLLRFPNNGGSSSDWACTWYTSFQRRRVDQWEAESCCSCAFFPAFKLLFKVLIGCVKFIFPFCPIFQTRPVPDQAFMGDVQYRIRIKFTCIRIPGTKRTYERIALFPENIQHIADNLSGDAGRMDNIGYFL